MDNVGQLKVAGFGLLKLSRLSQDKAKLAHHKSQINSLGKSYSYCVFPSDIASVLYIFMSESNVGYQKHAVEA